MPQIALTDKVLAARTVGISALEREVDMLVYRLYGLSEEEIKIVEGK